MTPKDFVKYYYDQLKERHYKPLESWPRDCKQAKRFIDSGRTFEQFQNLLHKSLIGPKEIQMGVCQGLHRFMYLLPQIELIDEKPWEPSQEERNANIQFIQALTQKALDGKILIDKPIWRKNPNGGWLKQPRQ